MDLDKAREAYQHDPQYHHLVDLLVNQIETLNLTPSEIRGAAMFACLILEERRVPTMFTLGKEALKRLASLGLQDSTGYRKFVLGDWDPMKKETKTEVEDL